MSEPFLGELRIVSFIFAPKGWALANGQLLPINQNQALFSLFGTMYGGDGRVNFALPDMRARVPIHVGDGHIQGEKGGEAAHTLTQSEMPQHIHFGMATATAATLDSPAGNVLAKPTINAYGPAAALTAMNAGIIGNAGGSQAHLNQQPFLVLNFIVALQGIFPSRN